MLNLSSLKVIASFELGEFSKNSHLQKLIYLCWAKNIFVFLPRMVAAHRPKEIKYATSKLLKFKIEVDHLVPKISVIHIPGNYIRQGCTVPKNWVQWSAVFQSGSRVLKRCYEPFYLYLYPSISMAYNVISCRKIAKNAQILKLLNSQYKLGSRAQKSPKYTQKNFAINRDLLNFFLHR